jgi:hypothetical protein
MPFGAINRYGNLGHLGPHLCRAVHSSAPGQVEGLGETTAESAYRCPDQMLISQFRSSFIVQESRLYTSAKIPLAVAIGVEKVSKCQQIDNDLQNITIFQNKTGMQIQVEMGLPA